MHGINIPDDLRTCCEVIRALGLICTVCGVAVIALRTHLGGEDRRAIDESHPIIGR